MTDTPDTTNRAFVDTTTAAALLDGLDAYNLVYVTGTLYEGRPVTTWKLMARDFPRAERRFTNLTTGFEVFDIASFMANVNVTDVTIADDKDQAYLALVVAP